MIVPNSKWTEPYWDEGQKGPVYYRSYAKKKMKRTNRKRWIKQRLKEFNKE